MKRGLEHVSGVTGGIDFGSSWRSRGMSHPLEAGPFRKRHPSFLAAAEAPPPRSSGGFLFRL